ncbi:hypothetical protein NMY22_g19907 [Coprinellus aureogranulatus]|nr:hypothetical protein NMY22_g19907 [Coprinellus aureogranulatus]
MEPGERCFSLEGLPEDVVRLMFQVAAAQVPRGGIICALVSKQVKSWVEPILYRDVVVDRRGRFHRTVMAYRTTKPPNFFATHVKSLFFDDETLARTRSAMHILERCHSVQSLALWEPERSLCLELESLFTSKLLAPTHLSISAGIFGSRGAKFSHPIFKQVTRLRIDWGPTPKEAEWDWRTLRALTRLTHLAVVLPFHWYGGAFRPTLSVILPNCPSNLEVLVISPYSLDRKDEVLSMNRGAVDHRLVVQSNNSEHQPFTVTMESDEIREEWERPSTCKTTLWSKAEELIRSRQSPPSV